MSSVAIHLKSNRKRYLRQLKELLSIPSVSNDPECTNSMQQAAQWVHQRLLEAGCKKAAVHKTERHPIVYGEWMGAPGAPTILVYGHYDVQPVDPLDLWKTPPFKPTVVRNRIYARGASDDKGQFLIHLNALEAHLAASRSCPVNVKFLIEGEEEVGSPSLQPFIKQNKKQLACDVVVISDTAMFDKGVPSICYGLRGLSYLELTLKGSKQDLHSGIFGGSVINPAGALAQMLSSLKDAKGRVTVTGFYDNVKRLSVPERRAIAALPYSERKFRAGIGAPELYGEHGYSNLERLWARPCLDINGVWSGWTGTGAKTVIPAEAHAKISMRLVPNQTSKEIGYKVTAYLRKIAPKSVKISVRNLHGGEAWITPKEDPALQAASRALKRSFGVQTVFTREGGSIPVVADFGRMLRVPIVLMGFGLKDDNLHAPNEKFDLDQFYHGMESSAFLMEELAVGARQAPNRARTRKRVTKRR